MKFTSFFDRGPILGLRSARLGVAFAVVVGAALCTSRLFGLHGVESALVLGALFPPWAAVIGARLVVSARRSPTPTDATALLLQSVAAGWLLLAPPLVLLALNALRIRNCDPLQGATFMVLGPVAGVALASVWGVLAASLTTRSSLATALAVAGPLGAVVAALVRFYASPAIFSYGHFFGYFPGTLYDEALQLPTPLLTLRLATLALTVGFAWLFVGHYDVTARRLRVRPTGPRIYGVASMLCFGIVVAMESSALALGHATNPQWIAQQLGRTLEGRRCRVVVPRELNRDEAERLRDDCDFRVWQMERVIGVTQRSRVTAFFFRSSDEKRVLMGAATTYIAKPWRNEVYLQLNGWPHPVLAHEIAHVVAGNLAPVPFRVAAGWGGLWPEASLIEGLAVAAAWDASDGLTPHQWSRAMLDLNMSPSIQGLFGTGFLTQPKARAYTLAGSFLKYVAETRGWKVVREIYRSGGFATVGTPLAELEAEWLAFIRRTDLPSEGLDLASQRFSHGSIFSSVCPHQVANLRLAVQGDLAAQDFDGALNSCRALLDVDPADTWARTTLLSTLARKGATARAEAELASLVGPPSAPAPTIWAAKHALADAAWRRGDLTDARGRYDELLADAQSEDATRLLEVKRLALTSPQAERKTLFALLVGDDSGPPDPVTAVHLAHELTRVRSDGLGPYLEARQLFFVGGFAEAVRLMENARIAGLPTERLQAAALRIEAISRFVVGPPAQADATWNAFAALGGETNRLEAADWAQRIKWRRHHIGDSRDPATAARFAPTQTPKGSQDAPQPSP